MFAGRHSLQLPAGWEQAFDATHGRWYFFNRALNTTSWTPPAHPHFAPSATPHSHTWPPAHAHASAPTQPSGGGQLAAAAPAPSSTSQQHDGLLTGSGSGWYYRDPRGALQGPFEQDGLQAWRPYLPMDLAVWYVDMDPEEEAEEADEGTELPPVCLQLQEPGTQQQEQEQGVSGSPAEEGLQGAALQQQQQEEGAAVAAAAATGRQEAAGSEPASSAAQGGRDAAAEGAEEHRPAAAAAAAAQPEPKAGQVSASAEPGAQGKPPPRPRQTTAAAAPDAAADPQQAGAMPDADIIAAGLPGIELAELLGDAEVLQDWRRRFPDRPPGSAPPAPIHERWLRGVAAATARHHAHAAAAAGPSSARSAAAAGANGAQPGGAAGQGRASGSGLGAEEQSGAAAPAAAAKSRQESMLEYAEAVLSGLPPDDEAVLTARRAAAAGLSLADIVGTDASSGAWAVQEGAEGSAEAAEYVRDPRSGRLSAATSGPDRLYGEYGKWVNPEKIEQYLAQAKRWREEKLPALFAAAKGRGGAGKRGRR